MLNEITFFSNFSAIFFATLFIFLFISSNKSTLEIMWVFYVRLILCTVWVLLTVDEIKWIFQHACNICLVWSYMEIFGDCSFFVFISLLRQGETTYEIFNTFRHVTRIILGQGSFERIKALDKHLPTTWERKTPQGKNLRLFRRKILKNFILNDKFYP